MLNWCWFGISDIDPTLKQRWNNAASTLGQNMRRCASINTALGERIVLVRSGGGGGGVVSRGRKATAADRRGP